MSDDLYPLELDPKLTTAVWGGSELVERYGKHADANAKLGESWECWDENLVANGLYARESVAQLRSVLGPQLLGDLDAARIFPILTKIITAHDWLSVQVHPDDAYAQRVENQPNGKTECWFVFDAKPGAEIVLGWTRDTSREEYERRVADGTLGEILRKIPVRAGDTIYIPAGLVHAIGPGITLFETQQASDLTYRMFDWNRMGLDGKPRELHVQKAGDVLNYARGGESTLLQVDYQLDGLARTALIDDARFTVERIVAPPVPVELSTNARPLILMTLDQPMEVASGGTTLRLDPYRTAIVPAAADRCTVRAVDAEAPFTFVTPPAQRDQLRLRMLAAGVPETAVEDFARQF